MNLLPSTQKEMLKRGLRLRSFVVAAILASLFLVVGTIMLLPAYFLTSSQFASIVFKNSMVKSEDESEVKSLLSMPSEIENKLIFIESNFDQIKPVDILIKIIGYKPDKVKISSISFGRNQIYKETSGTMVLITGTSVDRASLTDFSTALEKSNLFSYVVVPVSNLAKEKDLPFSMNIFIKNKK